MMPGQVLPKRSGSTAIEEMPNCLAISDSCSPPPGYDSADSISNALLGELHHNSFAHEFSCKRNGSPELGVVSTGHAADWMTSSGAPLVSSTTWDKLANTSELGSTARMTASSISCALAATDKAELIEERRSASLRS